jgi:hypothetical protein
LISVINTDKLPFRKQQVLHHVTKPGSQTLKTSLVQKQVKSPEANHQSKSLLSRGKGELLYIRTDSLVDTVVEQAHDSMISPVESKEIFEEDKEDLQVNKLDFASFNHPTSRN